MQLLTVKKVSDPSGPLDKSVEENVKRIVVEVKLVPSVDDFFKELSEVLEAGMFGIMKKIEEEK